MSHSVHALDDYLDALLSPPADPAPGPAATLVSAVAHGPSRPLPVPAAPSAPAPEPEPVPEPPARWLRLRCGGQTYALELLRIREVLLPAPLLPLRGVKAAVSGVMNLRGQVVPVMDLGLHFNGVPVESSPAARIVVLEEHNEVLGLQVSAVEDIVQLEASQVEAARNSRLAPVGDRRIRGIARVGGRVMLLLDAGHLLATPLH